MPRDLHLDACSQGHPRPPCDAARFHLISARSDEASCLGGRGLIWPTWVAHARTHTHTDAKTYTHTHTRTHTDMSLSVVAADGNLGGMTITIHVRWTFAMETACQTLWRNIQRVCLIYSGFVSLALKQEACFCVSGSQLLRNTLSCIMLQPCRQEELT